VRLAVAKKQPTATQADEPKSAAQAKRPQNPVPDQQTRMDRFGDPLPADAVARLGTLRLRGVVAHAFAFAADGRTFLTVSDDPTVRIWNADTGRRSPERHLPVIEPQLQVSTISHCTTAIMD